MQRLFLVSPEIVKLGMDNDDQRLTITASDSFNLSSARLNKAAGAGPTLGPPLCAITRIHLEPRGGWSEAACSKRLARMVPGFHAELDCSSCSSTIKKRK
jgi:hypothetical protein